MVALAVGGCALNPHQPASTVTQKQDSSQTQNTQPYNQAPAPRNGQYTAPSIIENPLVVTSSPPPSGKLKAAILLPLSGKNAALGQAMLNAAQQAVFDAAGNNFELQPHDTDASGGAERAAQAAFNDGAQLIIGPLFAADVPDVKLVAQVSGLQILPLSTDTTLAERGVYVMGLAPGAQVERVMTYAMARGVHRFAALVPSTPYGNLVGQIFLNSAPQHGASVVDIETFDPAAHNLDQKIKVLAAHRDQIEALFLPESGNDLKNVADQLTAAGFDAAHVHILGTGLWDVPGIGSISPLLIGGWYAAPDPATRRNFVASYKVVYGQEPPRLATLAYDATALAAVLAKHNTRYDEAALTNPNGFAGLDGIFRLLPSGVVERALAVNEVTADGARVIDTAPTSFVGDKR